MFLYVNRAQNKWVGVQTVCAADLCTVCVPSIWNMKLCESEAADKWNITTTSHRVLHCSCCRSDCRADVRGRSKHHTQREKHVLGWRRSNRVWQTLQEAAWFQFWSQIFLLFAEKQQEQKWNADSERRREGGRGRAGAGGYLHVERPVRGRQQERARVKRARVKTWLLTKCYRNRADTELVTHTLAKNGFTFYHDAIISIIDTSKHSL